MNIHSVYCRETGSSLTDGVLTFNSIFNIMSRKSS